MPCPDEQDKEKAVKAAAWLNGEGVKDSFPKWHPLIWVPSATVSRTQP